MEILTNEEKVLKYIKRKRTTPLIFKETGSRHYIPNYEIMSSYPEKKVEDYNDLFDLISELFILAKTCASVNINTDKMETSASRTRSVFDIWRHIKYYLPEITIFEVMREFYKNRNYLSWNYCTTVHRLVFYCCDYDRDEGRITEKRRLWLFKIRDEYGLCFSDWKDIGLEKECFKNE